MAQSKDLADRILAEAGKLFREQGYAATTIKQIAAAAGCTTAALYYYYEGGKSEILTATIRAFPTPDELLARMGPCNSPAEFVVELTSTLALALPEMADQIAWLLFQFPTLPDEEKEVVQSRIMRTHNALRERLAGLTADEGEADRLAWVIFTAVIGYHQVFLKAEMDQRVEVDLPAYGRLIAELVARSGA
jgi:AcrR family transcriptional regulator